MKLIKIINFLFKPFFKYFYRRLLAIAAIIRNPTVRIEQNAFLKDVKLGKHNLFAKNTMIINSSFGDYSYVADNSVINNALVGKFTCIGPNVLIGPGDHPINECISVHPVFFSTHKQVGTTFVSENYFNELPHQCQIGNDVWIGANVIILGGITIGDGAIVAAGSVLTKNVNPYEIVGGIPAKVIKKRFDNYYIDILIKYQWWNKDERWLKENSKRFNYPEEFIKMLKNNCSCCD